MLLLLAPLWLQAGLGSTTHFAAAPPRSGLFVAGNLVARAGVWTSDHAAIGGVARVRVGGVESLAIEGGDGAGALGPLTVATGGGFARLSPWGGSVIEFAAFAGGAGWSRWQPAAGGHLTLGWSWWTGTFRWGFESTIEAAGGPDDTAWFGSSFAIVFSGGRPSDR